MHLFFQAGKKKNLLKIILATVIAIFIIITLFISFNNYFVGNLQGFILSPNFVYEGSDLNLILSLRKSSDGEPVSGAKISINFSDSAGKFIETQNIITDPNGNANISQLIPTDSKENVNILAFVKSNVGNINIKKTIPIKTSEKIDVFIDKNEYLPGENIFLQCRISSKNASHGDRNLNIKLIDKEGKILYSKTEKTEAYGFFTGKIPIGKLLKNDTYKINVSTSKALFEKKIKIGYANSFSDMKIDVIPPYFVSGEKSKIKISCKDKKITEKTKLTLLIREYSDSDKIYERKLFGVLDSSGNFSVDYVPSDLKKISAKSPNYIDINAIITQNNDEYSYSKSYPLSKEQILTFFIPEDSFLTSGLKNRLFIFTCLPDGTPIETNIKAELIDKTLNLKTSSEGITEFFLDPAFEKGHVPLFTVIDKNNKKSIVPFDISEYSKPVDFTISTKDVCFDSSNIIPLTINSLDKKVNFIVFLLKNGEIVSSQTVKASLNLNSAKTEIQIPKGLSGFCKISVIKIDAEGNLQGKNIPIYIMGRDTLSVEVNSDKKIYAPEDKAKITFKMNNLNGVIFTYLEKNNSCSNFIEELLLNISSDFPLNGLIDKLNSYPKPIQMESENIQNLFRVILSKNKTLENDILFEDLYKQALQSGYEFKINYYKSIFSCLMKIFLWVAILSFLVLFFLTIKLSFISIFSKKEKISEFLPDETAGAVAFNIGIPLTFFISFLSLICLMTIKQLDINTLFMSRNIIWINAIVVVSLFLYLLTIRHFIDKHTVKQLDKTFLNILSVMFIYILSLTLSCTMTIIAYINLWGLWNYKSLFITNISLSEFVLLTFLIMPFLTLTVTFLRFDVFENNKIYKPIFLSLSFLCCLFIIFMSFFGYKKFVTSNNFLTILSSADKIVKNIESNVEQKDIQKNNYKQFEILHDRISSMSVYPDKEGNGTAIFTIPDIVGDMTVKTHVFTENGSYYAPEIKVKSEKDFLFSIDSPEVINIGENKIGYIKIKNKTNKKRKVSLICKGTGSISLNCKKKGNFYLNPNEEIVKKFEIKVIASGIGEIRAKIISDSYFKQIDRKIKIISPYKIISRTTGGKLGGSISQKVRLSDIEFKNLSNIEVSFYPNILSHYYNCDSFFDKDSPKYAVYYSDLIKIKLMRLKNMKEKGIEGIDKIEEDLVRLIQDLLTFENKDGSFKILDNSQSPIVVSVSAFESLNECFSGIYQDEENLNKIYNYLISKQKENGSWEENERTTAKVAYVMSKSKFKESAEFKKAIDYLKKNALDSFDPYTLSYTALALSSIDIETTEQFAGIINKNVLHTHEMCYWNALSGLYSYDQGIETDVQATALCIRVLMSVKGYDDVVRRGINFLLQERAENGTWYSTSASVDVLETIGKIFENVSEDYFSINLNINSHDFKCIYLNGQKETPKITIDKKYVKKENIIKITSPNSEVGSYLITINTFDKN